MSFLDFTWLLDWRICSSNAELFRRSWFELDSESGDEQLYDDWWNELELLSIF